MPGDNTSANEQQDDTGTPVAGGADSTATLAHVASSLADDMPAVQEHAVQQAQKEAESVNNSQTDKAGVVFDPNVHVTGPDGAGRLTVRGTWELKRGRKAANGTNGGANVVPLRNAPKSTLGGPAAPPSPAALQAQQNAAQEAQRRAAGIAAAEMLFAMGQVIGGEEWAPMQNKSLGLDERTTMHSAFAEYFVKTGKDDIPPGAALTFCVIAYIAPRFAMPKTQTRFQKVKGAVVTWWTNRKLRKMGLDVQVQQKKAEGDKK